MDDYDHDPQKKQFKLLIRKEANKLNQVLKHRAVNGQNDSKLCAHTPNVISDDEIDKYISLEDREELRKKFQCLAVDNCQLRDKTTCLRYELETVQDKLEETQETLYAVKQRERANRDELAYLRHLSTTQAEEIKSLQEHVKHLNEFLHENGLEYRLENTDSSTSPVVTKFTPADESKSQFSQISKDFLQASENTE
ncbi:hypothetical protein FGIG_11490 [Fasciola gigantica]|uniref:Uncharacterized protein n=1 Tax=Fasciola gigantica TaxID=46835 RepID=A0A504YC22_FASGI|nr:hypothetical protein FGIG_11490 [Fasciola gigantica]